MIRDQTAAKQQLRLETNRPTQPHAVRQAILSAARAAGCSSSGVFSALVDKFPLGALMNNGLTLRAAQQHASAISRCCWTGWPEASSRAAREVRAFRLVVAGAIVNQDGTAKPSGDLVLLSPP